MALGCIRETVSGDSTVVGPAGGTLLFLITPHPAVQCSEGCPEAQLSEKGEIVELKCVLFDWSLLHLEDARKKSFSSGVILL